MMYEKLQQFINFCGRQPKDRHYRYDDANSCALGQFNHYNSDGWDGDDFPMCDTIASRLPHTFGALTERLREHFGQFNT